MRRNSRVQSVLALITASSLLLPAPLIAGGRQGAPAKPAATPEKSAATPGKSPAAPAKPQAPAAVTPAPIDGGWPRAYTMPSGGQLTLYQPQVAAWAGQKNMG